MQLLQMAGSRANLLLQTVASSLTLRSVHSIGCSTSKGLDTIILSDMYCEISRLVIFHSTRWIMYLSYASAHAYNSSNHSYVSMNMDSIDDRGSRADIYSYRSFFDYGVYESTAPLLELPISPSINLAESSPQPQNDGTQTVQH